MSMLHRLSGGARDRRRLSASPIRPRPVSPLVNFWLRAPGSLTARLRTLGDVRVQVHFQGSQRLWPAERQALRDVAGHVREVTLLLDGRPVVWARSVTRHRALKGPWKALKGLGSRPLAELLFSDAKVRRGPLCTQRWRPASEGPRQVRRHWPDCRTLPRWSRHSLFTHHGQPLRVMEAFPTTGLSRPRR